MIDERELFMRLWDVYRASQARVAAIKGILQDIYDNADKKTQGTLRNPEDDYWGIKAEND